MNCPVPKCFAPNSYGAVSYDRRGVGAPRTAQWYCGALRGAFVIMLGALCACFSSAKKDRSYFVLQGVPTPDHSSGAIDGLVRVRDLDSATIYEKFQIVVRRNPYELRYSEENVWAVKPNRMVSDIIAHGLAAGKQFSAVRRELGEMRPDYILGGDIEAIEVYDSGDAWYAHLSLGLSLTNYRTSETLLNYTFDQRKSVPGRTFAQAARALSELLSLATDGFSRELAVVKAPRVKLKSAPVVPRGHVKEVRSKRTRKPQRKAEKVEPARSSEDSPVPELSSDRTDPVDRVLVKEPDDGTIFVPVH